MTEKEQTEKSHQMATEWFTNHKAKFILNWPDLTVIEWRRPDTGNYAMRYIVTGGSVIVTGDVGDAVYGFSQPITFEKLASFDWHYFVNKCTASETGRNYTMKIPGVGRPVANVRAIGHFVGLQMAIKQLTHSPNASVNPSASAPAKG